MFNSITSNLNIKKIEYYNKFQNGEIGLKICMQDKESNKTFNFLVNDYEFKCSNFKMGSLSNKWRAYLYSQYGYEYLQHLAKIYKMFPKDCKIWLQKDKQEVENALTIIMPTLNQVFENNKEFFDTNVFSFVLKKQFDMPKELNLSK